MKPTQLPFWGFVLAGTLIGASARGADIDVSVTGVGNARGHVVCGLFASASGFPGEAARAVATARTAADPAGTRCAFHGVAPGRYAIAVFHDENDNGVLDANLLGVPREGYGVSNNHTHALRAPGFDESRFDVETGTQLALQIALRY